MSAGMPGFRLPARSVSEIALAGIARDALDDLRQRHAEPHHGAHHVGQRFDRPNDVELLQIGADGVRDQILRECLLGHVPGEIVAAEAEIEDHAAPLGIAHDREHLAAFVDHLTEIAVIEVRDHVAGFGDPECLGRQQMLGILQLEFADVHVERQIEDLREPLGQLQRAGTVVAHRIAFDVAQHVAILLREIDPAGDRHLAERADIAFDEIQSEQTHRTDEGAGIQAGLEIAQQLHELIEHADARDRRRRRRS